jgi:hypothetical protein
MCTEVGILPAEGSLQHVREKTTYRGSVEDPVPDGREGAAPPELFSNGAAQGTCLEEKPLSAAIALLKLLDMLTAPICLMIANGRSPGRDGNLCNPSQCPLDSIAVTCSCAGCGTGAVPLSG